LPGQQSRVNEQRVWRRALGRHLGEFAENHGEHDHGQQRLDERPSQAYDGLLVAHSDIAPSEHEEQFPIPPKITPVMALGHARLDDEGVAHINESRA
jgi:hypothetical protein